MKVCVVDYGRAIVKRYVKGHDGGDDVIMLTEKELEDIWRYANKRRDIKKQFVRDYMKTDHGRRHFTSAHLAEFPELLHYLCDSYEKRNGIGKFRWGIMRDAVYELEMDHASPELFVNLSLLTADNGRRRAFERMANLLYAHQETTCRCHMREECPAMKYISGEWDISEFFGSVYRKE